MVTSVARIRYCDKTRVPDICAVPTITRPIIHTLIA